MAEKIVKEKVCDTCGAEVRPNAVFCYNCGSAVAPEVPLGVNKTQKISSDWFKGDLVEDRVEAKTEKNVSGKNETKITEPVEKFEPKEIYKPEVIEKKTPAVENEKRDLSKMDSAANLRRREKSLQKKRVEVVWEEHDNAPNGWFIFIAILLAALAVGIWFAARSLG